ncbi:MAG TPA: hypothetical protein VHR18_10445 [Solirubrobacterales bacterium]|jgi:hypothetical protein|nr:hypothetical protein [Solirubrobacterales bacterium]
MTNTTNTHARLSGKMITLLLILTAAFLITLAVTASAEAALQFDKVSLGFNEPPALNPDGTPVLNADGTFVDRTFNRQAGSHPDLSFFFKDHTGNDSLPVEAPKDIEVDLPLGFVGNPNGIPSCLPADLQNPGQGGADCGAETQVGVAEIEAWASSGTKAQIIVGLYNVAHGPDVPARFGFKFSSVVGLITARVRPGDYGISSGSLSISQGELVESARITLWGVPGDPSHDTLRQDHLISIQAPTFNMPQSPQYWRSLDVKRPFLTMPTSCTDTPLGVTVRGDSWEHPGVFDERTLTADAEGTPFTVEGCERLPFNPSAVARSTSREADAPSGLSVDIHVPQPQDPYGFATAHVRKVRLTLPKGMAVSPSSATGLQGCSLAQIGIGTNDAPTCPEPSKLGTVELDTPLLEDPLIGDVILAKQSENPFNSLLALYIAAKGPGFYLKLPGRIDLDPNTGQLTSTFDNNPQLPFEDLHLKLSGGPRAALVTPPACGDYNAQVEFVSWASSAPVTESIPMKFDQGCATGGFNPGLRAGSTSPLGGEFAPFNMQIVRAGGEQNLSRIQATLPEGLLAKLAGVPLCGDAQAVTGDCPAASQVGKVTVGAGAGPLPVYVPEAGKAPTAAYLAGPYNGAPYSLVVKVPAQAGPFDLGTVAVRNALRIDPTTTQVTAVSDPLPQILQGIPISYRDVRVEIDRPDFTVNPTNCKAKQITSVLTSATGQTASPSARFQVAGCGELGFGPSLQISLKGNMNRTKNPALTAVLKAPKGEANIAKTTVILPKSSFIDNAHINNPCTRVQFNANACPPSSILGTATAYSPLLDKPLTGPVYFRSNGGERDLPDLAVDLNGAIHVTLLGFIDSVKAGKESTRVRTRFQSVPDAPVTKFVLKMKGGKKGLIENSANLCASPQRAKVQMTGQNGKPNNFSQLISTSCGKSAKRK